MEEALFTKEEEEILKLTEEIWNRFLASTILWRKMKARDIRSLASLCVVVVSWYAFITKA